MKVFSGMKGLKVPDFLPNERYEAYDARCEEYKAKVIEMAKAQCSDPLVGEEATFPVADGYARYLVLSMKPLHLLHLPFGDAWSYQYINRLTASDIRKNIEGRKSIGLMFAKK